LWSEQTTPAATGEGIMIDRQLRDFVAEALHEFLAGYASNTELEVRLEARGLDCFGNQPSE
jgi:hypothetical protein